MNTISLLNDAKYFDDKNTKVVEIRKLLDSKFDKEKLEALKRIHAVSVVHASRAALRDSIPPTDDGGWKRCVSILS